MEKQYWQAGAWTVYRMRLRPWKKRVQVCMLSRDLSAIDIESQLRANGIMFNIDAEMREIDIAAPAQVHGGRI